MWKKEQKTEKAQNITCFLIVEVQGLLSIRVLESKMQKKIHLCKLNNTRKTKLYISDKAASTEKSAERQIVIKRG